MTMLSDDPAIVALGTARGQTQRSVAAGRPGGPLDPRAFLDGYRAALADCPLDESALVAIRDELEARLAVGLTRSGRSEAVGSAFSDLLYRYEACVDALDREGARLRLARWEVLVADMMIAARGT